MTEKSIIPELAETAQQLSEFEKANIAFSKEVHRQLLEALPNANELPLVYIGSGGDLVSARVLPR